MRLAIALVVCVLSSFATVASAQTEPPAEAPPSAAENPAPSQEATPTPVWTEATEHASHRPGFGLLLGAGMHTGLALGARFGFRDLGIEATGGYQLLLMEWTDPTTVDDRHFEFASSAQIASELYWNPWHPMPESAIGLKAGYRYNTVLTHGFSLAVNFLIDLNDALALEVLAGASIFPGQRDRLFRELGVSKHASVIYDSTYQFFEYGFELIWYP